MAEPQRPQGDGPKDLLGWLGFTDAPNWKVARPLGSLLGVCLTLLFALSFAAAFYAVCKTFVTSAEPSTGNLGSSALLVALLGAPFLIWNTIIKHKALGFQKEGHITDRIAKAVEQLGADKVVKTEGAKNATIERTAPNIEVRIGGIYALERIAQDSMTYDYGRDHIQIMEILCAYVRENAPAKDLEPTAPPFTTKTPRIDIQTAMNVIKRRKTEQVAMEAAARYRLDLRGTDLDGCDLRDGKFAGAIFMRSRLEATGFRNCDLTGAQLQGCLINFTDFYDATLCGTNLDFCNIPHLDNGARPLTFGHLKGVSVVGADVTGLEYFSEQGPMLFGSKDTKLSPALEATRRDLLQLKAQLRKAKYEKDSATAALLEHQIAQTDMGHWFDHDSTDMALNWARKKFLDSLGLKHWPHTDT